MYVCMASYRGGGGPGIFPLQPEFPHFGSGLFLASFSQSEGLTH